jgi:hypothetical protein
MLTDRGVGACMDREWILRELRAIVEESRHSNTSAARQRIVDALRTMAKIQGELGNYDILDENRRAGLLSREYERLKLGRQSAEPWMGIKDHKSLNSQAVTHALFKNEVLRENGVFLDSAPDARHQRPEMVELVL